jgi:hypothetical protein
MQNGLFAIFEEPEEALDKAAELRREGFPPEAIRLLSSEPVADDSDVLPPSRSRIGLFAILGGVSGAIVGLGVTVWTSQRVNLVTGGMPIVQPWALGIIAFEVAALGAIAATLIRTVVEAKLGRSTGNLERFDQEVGRGNIVLVLTCDESRRAEAERLLRDNDS